MRWASVNVIVVDTVTVSPGRHTAGENVASADQFP
jgi:hypothetical protein